jgi:hypothetical protein
MNPEELSHHNNGRKSLRTKIPPIYRWRLEEKNVQNLELALTNCLDFKEQIRRTGLSFGIHDSHKYLSSLIPIIKSLQDHMFFLESQSSIHAYLNISWDSSLLGPNYNNFTNCGRELEHEEYPDYIMMLEDQPTSHVPNTNLLRHCEKTQS